MGKRIALFVALAVALAGLLVWAQYRPRALTVSGFVEADEIRIGSRVGGRVARVLVEEGQAVRAGDVLVELEPFDWQERLAAAKAEVAQREAEHRRLVSGYRAEEIAQAKARHEQLAAAMEELVHGPRKQQIEAARAEVDRAQAQVDYYQRTYERVQAVFARSATTEDELSQASDQLRIAQASLRGSLQQLSELEEGTRPEEIAQARARVEEAKQAWALMVAGYRAEDIAQAAAALEGAKADMQAIERQIAELTIRAPVDGTIEALELQAGDLVAANAPVLSIMDTANLWVRAYVPENHLDLQIDQRVPITVDSFADRRFVGRISFIARQGEFTPGNVQTPEERSKQVFRVKVTIEEGRDVLRPGMAADVWLDEKVTP